ncbi:uncharacterized protein [Rhodnius prolixus]|uniref:uncharacterized protein n=1 Tax=Rhodnius prolixus TaxID=13249 RepID=UPI003D18DA93
MGSEIAEQLKKLRLDLKADMEESRSKTLNELKQYFEVLENRVKIVETKMDTLDRELRKRNVVIFGAVDEMVDYWELESFVCNFFANKLELNIGRTDIDFVRRLGKRDGSMNRPILVGLAAFRSKLMIMQNVFKLKGSNFSISHDFPKDVIETRKSLRPKLVQARREGKFAVIKYNKLVVKDSYDPLLNRKRMMSASPPSKDQLLLNKDNKLDTTKRNKLEPDQNIIPNSNSELSDYTHTPRSVQCIDRKTSVSDS